MRRDGVLAPDLDERMAGWRIIGYITALNALFGAQIIGAGDRVYYGFLAQNVADPSLFVVVERGTGSVIEWIQNARFAPIPTQYGFVEAGFWGIHLSAQYKGQNAALGIAADIPSGSHVTVIGHSLGGALATYLTRELVDAANGDFEVEAQFFASPKPGLVDFVNGFETRVGRNNYVSHVFVSDFVPHLPPGFMGYHDLPNVNLIQPRTALGPAPTKRGSPLEVYREAHHATTYASLLGAYQPAGEAA